MRLEGALKERTVMKSRIFATAAIFASLLAGSAALKAQSITADRDRLNAYSRMTYNNIALYAGEHASVAVQGDGDTVLHVRVYDYNNYLIDETSCRVDACVVSWVAKWNANFYVTVENLGGVYNDYGFAVNRYY